MIFRAKYALTVILSVNGYISAMNEKNKNGITTLHKLPFLLQITLLLDLVLVCFFILCSKSSLMILFISSTC